MLLTSTFIWGTTTALTAYYYDISHEHIPLFISCSISIAIIIIINIISILNEINEINSIKSKTITKPPTYTDDDLSLLISPDNIISSPISTDLPSPKNIPNSGEVKDIKSINSGIVNYTCFSHEMPPEWIINWLEKYYDTELRPNGGIVTHHTEPVLTVTPVGFRRCKVRQIHFNSEYPNSQKMRIVVYKYGSGSFVTTSRWGSESDTIIFNNEYRWLVNDIGGKKEIYYPDNFNPQNYL